MYMHEIRPKLWLGSINAECGLLRDLQNKGITHIMQVGTGPMMQPSHAKNLKYCCIEVLDSEAENLLQKLQEAQAMEFISNCLSSGGAVLVHCYAGVSRSATTVIAYMMSKESLGFEDAMFEVMLKRLVISPNRGFCKQLRVLQDECDGQLANYRPEMLQGVDDMSLKQWMGMLTRVRERVRLHNNLVYDSLQSSLEGPGSQLPLSMNHRDEH